MQKWLRSRMKHFIHCYWGMDCELPIEINGKMKKTLGMYIYEREKGIVVPRSIQLSKEMIEYAPTHIIEYILKHELCHYALSMKSLPFMDGDKAFENELKRIDAPSSKMITLEYRIICTHCEKVYRCKSNAQAKQFTKKRISPCCQKVYIYDGVYYFFVKGQ